MDLFDLYAKISLDTSEYESSVKSVITSGKNLDNTFSNSEKKSESLKRQINLLSSEYSQTKPDVDQLTNSVNKSAKANENAADETENLSEEMQDAGRQSNNLRNDIDKLQNKTQSAGKSFENFGDKVKQGFSTAQKVVSTIGKTIAVGFATIAGTATAAGAALLSIESSTEEYRIAQGKLKTAFDTNNLSVESAQKTYSEFFKILGDVDTATEASQLLSNLVIAEKDLSTWTKIAAGVFGTFGDSLPIEGLIESANETSRTGQVTGVLADALNWGVLSTRKFGVTLKANTDANKKWNNAVMEAQSAEDYFNLALQECSTEAERNQLIMEALSEAYSDASDKFYENNQELINSRDLQNKMSEALSNLGNSISQVKIKIENMFMPSVTKMIDGLSGILSGDKNASEQLTEGFDEFINQISRNLLPYLSENFSGFFGDITGKIFGEFLPSLFEKLPDFSDSIFDFFSKAIKDVSKNSKGLSNDFVDLVTSIISGVSEITPKLLEAAITFASDLLDSLAASTQDISDSLFSLLDGIVETLTSEDGIGKLTESFLNLLLAVADQISENLPKIIEKLPEITEAIVTWLKQDLPTLVEVATEIVVSLISSIIKAVPELLEILGPLLSQFFQNVAETPEFVKEIGEGIGNAIWEGIWSVFDDDGVAKDLVDSIFGKDSTEIVKKAREMMESFGNEVKLFWDKFSLINEVQLQRFKEAGENIINAIKEGFEYGWQSLSHWISSIPILGSVFNLITGKSNKFTFSGAESLMQSIAYDVYKTNNDKIISGVNESIIATGANESIKYAGLSGGIVQNITIQGTNLSPYETAKYNRDLIQEALAY